MSKIKEKIKEEATQIKPVQKLATLSLRNKLAFSISTLSFIFLIPGIYLNMLTVKSSGEVTAKLPKVEPGFLGFPTVNGTQTKEMGLHIIDTSRSILGTVHDLWEKDYHFVGSMIFLFSVCIPVLKGILLTYVFFTRHSERREKIFTFIKSIGKWSMCDVFIVALLLSYLSTGAMQTQNTAHVTVMGYSVPVNALVGMHANLELGFWYFLGYCLLSLLALQLYEAY